MCPLSHHHCQKEVGSSCSNHSSTFSCGQWSTSGPIPHVTKGRLIPGPSRREFHLVQVHRGGCMPLTKQVWPRKPKGKLTAGKELLKRISSLSELLYPLCFTLVVMLGIAAAILFPVWGCSQHMAESKRVLGRKSWYSDAEPRLLNMWDWLSYYLNLIPMFCHLATKRIHWYAPPYFFFFCKEDSVEITELFEVKWKKAWYG